MPVMTQQRPPFRADHVGSLLRPKELREAFRKYGSAGAVNADFLAIQERAIRAVNRVYRPTLAVLGPLLELAGAVVAGTAAFDG